MGNPSSKDSVTPANGITHGKYILFYQQKIYRNPESVCNENGATLAVVKSQSHLDYICKKLKSISSNNKLRVRLIGYGYSDKIVSIKPDGRQCQSTSDCDYFIDCTEDGNGGRKKRCINCTSKLPFLCEKYPRQVTPNILANISTAATNSPRNITASSFPTNTTRKAANYSTPTFVTRPSAKPSHTINSGKTNDTTQSSTPNSNLTVNIGVIAFMILCLIGLFILFRKRRQQLQRSAKQASRVNNRVELATEREMIDEIHPPVEVVHDQVTEQQQGTSNSFNDVIDYVSWDHIKHPHSTSKEQPTSTEEFYATVVKGNKNIPSTSSHLLQHADDDVIDVTHVEPSLYAQVHK